MDSRCLGSLFEVIDRRRSKTKEELAIFVGH
jgi:hypothetical protein